MKIKIKHDTNYDEALALRTKLEWCASKMAMNMDAYSEYWVAINMMPEITLTEEIPTAAVDALGHTFYSPSFFSDKSRAQVLFAVLHEIGHYILGHPVRRGGRDPQGWNRAGDAYLNDDIREAFKGTVEWIDDIIDVYGARLRSAEELYEENPTGSGGSGGSGSGAPLGSDVIEGDASGDAGNPRPLSEGERREAEQKVAEIAAAAAHVSDRMGYSPGGMRRAIGDLLTPRVRWEDMLDEFLTARADDALTWTRPNRRFVSQELYLPSRYSEGRLGGVCVAIDVSGSISHRIMDAFVTETVELLTKFAPEWVKVIWWDSVCLVADADIDNPETLKEQDVYGGGGTDYACVPPAISALPEQPDVVICLTDGYVSWPTEEAIKWPHITIHTSRNPAPFGVSVQMEL